MSSGNNRAIFSISLAAFTAMVGVGIVVPLLPIFARSLGATGVWIGLIFSAFSFSRIIFLPVFGRMSDRYGKKRVISIGLAFYSIISLAYLLSKTPFELTVVRLIHGVTSAMVIPVAMALAVESAPDGMEGRHIGIFNFALFSGFAIGPTLGGLFTDLLGINYAFVSMSVLSLITLTLTILTFPETGKKESKERFRDNLRNKVVKAALIFRTLNAIGRGSIMIFLPVYCGILGFTSTKIGLLVSSTLMVSAIVQPTAGKIADKMGVVVPVVIGTSFSALILFLIPQFGSFYSLITLCILFGIASAVSIPAIEAAIAREGKAFGGVGGLMGIVSASRSLGRLIGPLILGVVFDLAGGGLVGIKGAFSVAALLTVFSAIAFWFAMKP